MKLSPYLSHTWIYENRFLIYLVSLSCILFGSLLFPPSLYFNFLLPVLTVINLTSGLVMIAKSSKVFSGLVILMAVFILLFIAGRLNLEQNIDQLKWLEFIVLFFFYGIITIALIRQLWKVERVNEKIIYGLLAGYLSLGLVGFFLFFAIELHAPGAFHGIDPSVNPEEKTGSLMYYSYITLLTIGYGDIYPIHDLGRKAAVLVGIIGQFYLVIITAMVLEKYIRHTGK